MKFQKIANLTANFVEQFTNVAQMLTIIFHSGMVPIVEHSGYADHLINPWRLDPNTLKFSLKGNLPYDSEITQPQVNLLRFVLEQPYSRDMVCSVLNLQKNHKQRCPQLEEQLVWLVLSAMERSELEIPVATTSSDLNQDSSTPTHTQWLWLHLSSQLIYFVLFQFATFPNIVTQIYEKLLTRDLRKGRDHLMWVLLQFISGSIQRNPLSNFLPVLKLYDILYPEREPLPVPDYKNSACTHQIAATCIWIHLQKKASLEHNQISRPIPIALKKHYEFLQHLANSTNLSIGQDYTIALLCNAYSTNQDYFSRPMQALIDTILGNLKPQVGIQNQPTTPLSMTVLDSLTVHSKMSLIHSIVTHMIKQAQMKNNSNAMGGNPMASLSPALVETYSRLLVYTEIESLGIKGFLTQLLPAVFKSNDWDSLYTLLEMFSYRMHHIQPHYRIQLLSHLHSLAQIPPTNQMQLHLCVESTALRLITGLGSAEVQMQLSRLESKNQSIISTENEELNRALILTIARSMHITGTGNYSLNNNELHSGSHLMNVKDLLNAVMQHTPHSWAQHTLSCFPPVLSEFFTNHGQQKENKQMLKKSVEEEYRNWISMSNENDIIAHFSGTPLFLCLLFKMILDNGGIGVVAYKILERIKARSMSVHLRKLCDFLVFEVANSNGSVHVNKFVDAVNDMIWKYNIVTIDRLVLCMALRTQEGSEAQVSFFIIQLLLLKNPEFRNRVQEFIKNSPEHWKQTQWHEKHLAFHAKFPEKFVPEEARTQNPHSVYFGNVCLRFLPVLDIVIHRYLEVCIVPAIIKSLEVMLEHLGVLYKFHDRPITYLYNTLHYYERKLRDRPSMKKKLVGAIINSMKDVRPANWALTEPYQKHYIQYQLPDQPISNEILWNPDITYYINLVKRLIDTIDGKNMFPGVDWRFNEFPNQSCHALYVTCVELLGLPAGPTVVANNIIDVIIKGYTMIPQNQIHSWTNAIGLIMSNLPEAYWCVIYDRLEEILRQPSMVEWPCRHSPFDMFNYSTVRDAMLEKNFVLVLAIAHSIFHHFGVGQTAKIIE